MADIGTETDWVVTVEDRPLRRVPSVEFRMTYAHLTEPVAVTVLGRVIGHWTPVGAASRPAHPDPEGAVEGADRVVSPAAPSERKAPASTGVGGRTEAPHRGGSVPPAGRGEASATASQTAPTGRANHTFTPAPKPGRAKR